jgi:hypothetical protein
MEQNLLMRGGRIVRTLRLQPEANEALQRLLPHYPTVTAAIEAALVGFAAEAGEG